MNLSDWLMILAVLLAPLSALQVRVWLDRLRERRQRKMLVFHALMATRAARVSAEHVQALNRINIDFYGMKIRSWRYHPQLDKLVVEAWKEYHAHLNLDTDDNNQETVFAKREELFITLLYQMSQCVGYDFDRTFLESTMYSPVAHGDEAAYQHLVRSKVAGILTGKHPIPIKFYVDDDAQEQTAKSQKLLLEYLEGKRPVRVRVESEAS